MNRQSIRGARSKWLAILRGSTNYAMSSVSATLRPPGWMRRSNFPTRKCMEDLDLKQVADDLEKIGKLGSG